MSNSLKTDNLFEFPESHNEAVELAFWADKIPSNRLPLSSDLAFTPDAAICRPAIKPQIFRFREPYRLFYCPFWRFGPRRLPRPLRRDLLDIVHQAVHQPLGVDLGFAPYGLKETVVCPLLFGPLLFGPLLFGRVSALTGRKNAQRFGGPGQLAGRS